MARRLQLQTLLETITEPPVHVYYQPPDGLHMTYPAITYKRDYEKVVFANNLPYSRSKRYLVTVIDRDPDSPIPDLIAGLPMCQFDRAFPTEGLNHSVYVLYF